MCGPSQGVHRFHGDFWAGNEYVFLSGILSHEEFKKGRIHTHFLEEQTILFVPEREIQADAFSFAASALSEKKRSQGIWEAVGPGGFW